MSFPRVSFSVRMLYGVLFIRYLFINFLTGLPFPDFLTDLPFTIFCAEFCAGLRTQIF